MPNPMPTTIPHTLDARILIVDDQAANVSLLEQTLQQAGYTQVSSTMNSMEVCALHRKNHYDLSCWTCRCPGWTASRSLKA